MKNTAFAWYKQGHRYQRANHDVWRIFKDEVSAGIKQIWFPIRCFKIKAEVITQTQGQNACRIKDISLRIWGILRAQLSPLCTHLKGHGGRKQTAFMVQHTLNQYEYLYRSDVQSYYASINLDKLHNMVCHDVTDERLQQSVHGILNRLIEKDGLFVPPKGLPLGCSLSPLMGAVYLTPLDKAMEKRPDVFYVRYMDDFIILGKTKRAFKAAVKECKQILEQLGLKEHPDKTFYKRIESIKADTITEEPITQDYLERIIDAPDVGFDFLGYHISQTGIRLRRETAEKMLNNKYLNPKPKKKREPWLKGVRWNAKTNRYEYRNESQTTKRAKRPNTKGKKS